MSCLFLIILSFFFFFSLCFYFINTYKVEFDSGCCFLCLKMVILWAFFINFGEKIYGKYDKRCLVEMHINSGFRE